MSKFYAFLLALFIPLALGGCFDLPNTMDVSDVYMMETPKTFPAGAIFMTVKNNTNTDDRIIDFKMTRAGRVELHTMATVNDIMKMRRVDGYNIASGDTHVLKPMADHVMVFDFENNFVEGERFPAILVFENAGEIPVTVDVRARSATHH